MASDAKRQRGGGGINDQQRDALASMAQNLYQKAAQEFDTKYRQQNASKAKWFEEVARGGTFSDRMSMVQLRVQQSPMFSLGHVIKLVEMLPKKGHRESHVMLSLLRDLFLQEYLPNDRKLIAFENRPLEEVVSILKGKIRGEKLEEVKNKLIEWQFESELKQCYFQFLQNLEGNASSALEGIAEGACSTMLRLLVERSEQEKFLLNSLINKLGHPSRRVASRVAHLLSQLVQTHGNMRSVVVTEVGHLIFRKNISERAQYYGVHFLNRLYLRAGESELACTMVKFYLNLFKIVIAKCKHDHPLIPLLITGINRAVPYARSLFLENGMLADEVGNLYKLAHNSKLSIALNVLKLLFNIHSASEGLSDRFYSAFYRRMLFVSPSSLNQQFFAFFLRTVKNDGVEVRVRAFLKRLFQIALAYGVPEFTAAALLLADVIIRERPHLIVLSKDECSLSNLTKNTKQEHTKSDKVNGGNNVARGDADATLQNRALLDDDDSEEERYYDVDTDSNDESTDKKNLLTKLDFSTPENNKPISKMVNGNETTVEFGGIARANSLQYNPMARNPLFANANLAVDVELLALAKHYHPTVQIFAKKIIAGEPIKYDNDPLENFTAMNFLERFAFKNPKQKDGAKTKNGVKKEKDSDDSEDEDIDENNEKLDEIDSEIDDEISDVDPSDVEEDDVSFDGDSDMEDYGLDDEGLPSSDSSEDDEELLSFSATTDEKRKNHRKLVSKQSSNKMPKNKKRKLSVSRSVGSQSKKPKRRH